jgi:DNA-3-methyladenine glycosylase I
MTDDGPTRCVWAGDDPLMIAHHDEEWGIPSRDPVHLFELLTLEGAQAGLSWSTILRKREGYRRAFAGFDVAKVARFTEDDVERLMGDASIVRNRAKIESTISNAQAILALDEPFPDLLWRSVGGEPIVNRPRTMADIPAETAESRALSRELKRRGFRFVGPTICYAFMQSAGLVNDHVTSCFRAPEWTDAEMEAHTIGEVTQLNAAIELAEYDPHWPELYAREERRIREALGDDARRVEHVGSTSVPGLAAKPVIDIVLAVPDSADEPAYVPALEAAGYMLRIREPKWFEHRLFKGPETNVNLHVFSDGCDEIERMIAFRDLLRTDPAELDRYLRTKRELAAREWRHVQHYADAKSAVVEDILARAAR